MKSAVSTADDLAFQRSVAAQFKQILSGQTRDFLVISELFKIKLSQFPVDFRHLGTIFMLNASKSGRICLEELRNFWSLCMNYQHDFPSHEFKMRIQGHGSMQLWEALQESGGKGEVVEWFIKMLRENMTEELQKQKGQRKDGQDGLSRHTSSEERSVLGSNSDDEDQGDTFGQNLMYQIIAEHPDKFVTMETVQLVHEMFQVQPTQGVSFQAFLDMLQQVGEERGLMELHEEKYDDVVPVDVLREFAQQFFDGFMELMSEIQGS
mmetsp:Transcript_21230/g.27418  ORF Transcript_21230/g.27418 Transcript_21230/m.27418 type:complete len:265 (+) Transcript_21230:107-901(+)